jgi:hypothetical protein
VDLAVYCGGPGSTQRGSDTADRYGQFNKYMVNGLVIDVGIEETGAVQPGKPSSVG